MEPADEKPYFCEKHFAFHPIPASIEEFHRSAIQDFRPIEAIERNLRETLFLRETNRRRYTTMNNVKTIVIQLLAIGVMTGFTQAATHESKPDATLRLSGGSFALGIGVSWGSGTLTYNGKNYPVKVNGLSVGKVGMTGVSAYGEVFNLKHLQDFNGHYSFGAAGRRGVTLASGQSGTLMTNQAGVIVRLAATQQGVDVNATGGGVDMQIKR
jgi:hypothetical protein